MLELAKDTDSVIEISCDDKKTYGILISGLAKGVIFLKDTTLFNKVKLIELKDDEIHKDAKLCFDKIISNNYNQHLFI